MRTPLFIVSLIILTGCAGFPGRAPEVPAAPERPPAKVAIPETPTKGLGLPDRSKPVLKVPDRLNEDFGGMTATGYQIVTILNYHDFSDDSRSPMQMPPREFEEQMRYLKQNGFNVISLEQFYDFINLKAGLPEKAVVITLDDGWKTTYTIAYPILKKYGFPATIFVYTDFIGHGPAALTWEMLKELSENNFDIEAHSKTHEFRIPWKKEDETESAYQKRMETELRLPKEIIEQRLGRPVRYIAYPFGQYNDTLVEAAKKYGYWGGLSVSGATVKEGVIVKRKGNPFFIDPFEVRRIQILAGTTLAGFAKKFKTSEDDRIYDGRYDSLFHLTTSK